MADRFDADGQKPRDVVVEQARLAALEPYRLLEPAEREGLSHVSREAASSLAATHAAVSFVDATRVWFAGEYGFRRSEVPRQDSFCDVVVRSASPLLVPDGRSDRRFCNHELVRGEPRLRCYAGAPLIDLRGFTLGTVAVFSELPAAFSTALLQDLTGLAVLVRDFLAVSRQVQPPPAPHVKPGPARCVQGWLGVKTLNTDEGRAGTMAGLVVLSVARGSPAQRAGIRPTDILYSIAGRELFVSADVAAAMAGRAVDSVVQVRFRRSGEWQESDLPIRSKRRRIKGR